MRTRSTTQPRPTPVPTARARALTRRFLEWFDVSARDLPWRRTSDPYAIWVSEVMLQQTQVATVIPYWRRWMRAFPDIRALAGADPERVLKLWEGLGYYSRARNLQLAAARVLSTHAGSVPHNVADLRKLPGVGRYTAGAIASIAFNQPAAIVDGNVARVLARVFAIDGDLRSRETSDQLWAIAAQLASQAVHWESRFPRSASRFNQAMMELGALLCRPGDPACADCPLRACCEAHRTGRVADLPRRVPRQAALERRFAAFVVWRRGKILLRLRPAGSVNAGLWEFPNAELLPGTTVHTAAESLGLRLHRSDPVQTLRHSITVSRIELAVFEATPMARPARLTGKWFSPREAEALACPAAHRKILHHLTRLAARQSPPPRRSRSGRRTPAGNGARGPTSTPQR